MPGTPQPCSPNTRRGAATFHAQFPSNGSGLLLDDSSTSPRRQVGVCLPSVSTNGTEDSFGGLLGTAALPFRRHNGDFGALAQIMNVARRGSNARGGELADDADDVSGLLSLSGQPPHQQQRSVFRAPLLGHVRAAARSNLEPALDSPSTSLAAGDALLPAAVLSTSAIGPNGAPLTVCQVSTLRVRRVSLSTTGLPLSAARDAASASVTLARDDETDENGRRNTGPYIPTDLGDSDIDPIPAAAV